MTFNNNILTDIYDGQLWETLKETRAENLPKFFDLKWQIRTLG